MNNSNSLSFLYILCGLLLFLFSLDQIKSTLNNLLETKLKTFITNSVNTKFKSFFIGFLTSAAIQSSSGTTAIAISLVSSKYIKPKDCLGIIIGANLGTCLTAFVLAINIDNIYLYLLTIGILIYFLINKIKKFSILIIYIGLMLLGLNLLSQGFNTLLNVEYIYNIINNIQNSNMLSVLFGILSTAIIQSSSGIIGIVEEMYSNNIVNLSCSLGIMLGANIGTTLTGYFATINTTGNTKKIVNMNLLFNILGVLIFLIIFIPFSKHIYIIQNKFFINNLKLSIAYGHFIFNFITVILGYVFFNFFTYSLNKENSVT